jgi:hypothetical protein
MQASRIDWFLIILPQGSGQKMSREPVPASLAPSFSGLIGEGARQFRAQPLVAINGAGCRVTTLSCFQAPALEL